MADAGCAWGASRLSDIDRAPQGPRWREGPGRAMLRASTSPSSLPRGPMLTLLLSLLAAQANDLPSDDADDGSGGGGAQYIINGESATEADYPMTGGVLLDGEVRSGGYALPMLMCSSTLIAPDVVLLAAHCVDMVLFEYYFPGLRDPAFVWTRQADLTAWDGSSEQPLPTDGVLASNWVLHEEYDIYDYGMGITQNHDIALLFLDEPVFDVPHAFPISPAEASQIVKGAQVEVVGWGQQTSDAMPPPGTYGVKMMGTSDISLVGPWEMQIGANADDVRKCHGDSGGPTFLHVDTTTVESMRVIGVTSHAYDQSDCRRTGGVDTRVDAYLDWIDDQMRAACAAGTRSWCEEEGILYAEDAGGDGGSQDGGAQDGGAGDGGLADGGGTAGDDTGDGGGADPSDDDDEESGLLGCGCSGAAGAPWAFGALLPVLALRRRRAAACRRTACRR